MIPFIYVDGELTMVIGGKNVHVDDNHPNWDQIASALETHSDEDMLALIECRSNLQKHVNRDDTGRVTLVDGEVCVDGKPMHNTIANRVVELSEQGFPFKHLLKFIEKAEENPSYTSKQELYDFLENKGLPITDDGCFLALKAVRSNFFDKYTGMIDNSPGCVVEMDRNKVDDNRKMHCSAGLHVGAMEYVHWYSSYDDKTIVVKVDPKDAVSVPSDHSYQKLRTCRYTVLYEFQGELDCAVYDGEGNALKPDKVFQPIYRDVNVSDLGQELMVPDDVIADTEDEYGCGYDEDDYWGAGDVVSTPCVPSNCVTVTQARCECDDFGTKPSGQKYHNVRSSLGRFTKKGN